MSGSAGPAGGRGGLRTGWTTGACATAAVRAAFTALLTGEFPDPVTITLPRGQTPAFALTRQHLDAPPETPATKTGQTPASKPGQTPASTPGQARASTPGQAWASASITKDAGDDPDVTHGAVITARVARAEPGQGVVFRAGPGVGTVTKPGLPLSVGEPAINPVPRRMIRETVEQLAALHGLPADLIVEISVDDGAEIATHTWNPRLGILGGISILGTTGVVIPYSCSAWIDSIRRGVDVARAAGRRHVAACTGSTSEDTVRRLYDLPDDALLDMGDFAGAVLKYLRRHPVPHLTVGGGIGKLAKLAAGHLDLHSARSQVDLALLARLAVEAGGSPELAERISTGTTALGALREAEQDGVRLGDAVAAGAAATAREVLGGAPIRVDVVVIDRAGTIVGRGGQRPDSAPDHP